MAPVNSTPDPVSYPAFTVTNPERAAMLEQGTLGSENVAVAGMVCDPRYPIASVTLNGTVVPVSGTELCQSFNVNVPSPWGLTILSGEARNNRGTVSNLAQAFLRSPTYFPPSLTKTPAAKIGYGIVGNLQTDAIDDNNRLTANDIGTLLSLLANGPLSDWNTSFPNPLSASPDADNDGFIDTQTYTCGIPPLSFDRTNRKTGYRISRGTLAHGTIAVSATTLSAPSNALRITVTAPDIAIPVTVFGALDLLCLGETDANVSGTLRASSVTIALTEVFSNGSVHFQDVVISASGVAVDVDFSGLSIINSLVSDIVTKLANAVLNPGWISNFVIQLVTPRLDDMIRSFFPGTMLSTLAGLQLALDPDPAAVPSGHDGVLFGEAVQVVADAARSGPAPAKGAIRSDGAAPKFGGPTKYPIGLAVKDDLFNQFLWAAWRRGDFDLASLSSFGCDGTVSGGAVSFATFALLPPVVMPGVGDSIAVGLGDLRLTGTVDRSVVGGMGAPITLTLYASGIATGLVAVTTSGTLTIAFAPTAQVAVQVAAISDSSALAQMRAAVAPFFACVVEKAATTALEGFPTPALKLPGLLPGKEWRVKSPKVGREGNYTTLKGAVEVH